MACRTWFFGAAEGAFFEQIIRLEIRTMPPEPTSPRLPSVPLENRVAAMTARVGTKAFVRSI
jgi:hypothetical protein